MKGIGIFETLLSTAVVALAAGFIVFLIWQTGIGSLSSYELVAQLADAGGIKKGADVMLAGVKVGEVESLALVQVKKRYAADLKLAIRGDIRVPVDSHLVVGGGTLSSTSLSIAPGRAKVMAAPGGMLK